MATVLIMGSGKAANHPVQTIDWYDCVKWCNARSEMEGRTPAYYTNAAQTTVYRTGQVDVDNNSCEMECGLPVADGGGVGEGGAGRVERAAVSVGEHDFVEPGELLAVIHRVLCLRCEHDEWLRSDVQRRCLSLHESSGLFCAERVWALRHGGECVAVVLGLVWRVIGSASQTDPRGPTSGSYRVLRGGGWDGGAFDCRSACSRRQRHPADGFYVDMGFRSVLPPGQ